MEDFKYMVFYVFGLFANTTLVVKKELMKFALYSVFHPEKMVSLTHRVAVTTSM